MPETQPSGAGGTVKGRARLVAVGVSAVQGLVLLGLGVFSIVSIAGGRADDTFSASLMAGLAVLTGAALLVAAWALWQGNRWARSPSLVWQLVMLPVGYETLDTQQLIGTALLISAVAALMSLLALERDDYV